MLLLSSPSKRSFIFIIPAILGMLACTLMQVPAAQLDSLETNNKDAYYHYSMGMVHHLDGEYEKAISEFELALKADPDNPYVMSRFASTLSKAGHITRAVETRQRSVELNPEDPELRYSLSRVYFELRAQESMRIKAEKELVKTLELDPAHNGALMDLGQVYWETGRWEDVIRVFSKLRQLDPSIVRVYLAEAQALEHTGKLTEAADVLISGLSFGKRIPDYLLLLGNYLEQLNRNKRAEEIYITGFENSPEPQKTQFNQRLAFLYNNMKEYEKALPLLQDLDGAYPQVVSVKVELARALRNTGSLEAAVEILEKAIILSPDNVQANFELSVVLTVIGERDRAIEVLENLLVMDNEEIGDYRDHFSTRLSLLYSEAGDYAKSVKALLEVVDRNPDDTEARLRLLQAYREADMENEADKLSKEMLEEHPGDPYVIVGRGQTLAARGKISEAVRFLKSRARSDVEPDGRNVIYMVLGQILVDEKRFVEALRISDESLSLNPGNERLLFFKASVYERQGDFSNAEKIFRSLLEKSPEDAAVMNYLGYMLVENNLKLEDAGEFLEKAVSLDPYNSAYQDSLGWLYFKLGRYEDARKHLLMADRIQKSDPVILEHLGDLYAKMGFVETAMDYYNRSIKVADSLDESKKIQKKLKDIRQEEK
jgi:tetratricopeptide (TPR) repeat protein